MLEQHSQQDPSARTKPRRFPPSPSCSPDQELGLDTLRGKLRGCSGQTTAHPFRSSSPPSRSSPALCSPLPAPEPSPRLTRQGESTKRTARLHLLKEASGIIPRHICPAQDGDAWWGLLLTSQPSKPLPLQRQTSGLQQLQPTPTTTIAHRGLTNTRHSLNRLIALRRSKTQSIRHQRRHGTHSPARGEHRGSRSKAQHTDFRAPKPPHTAEAQPQPCFLRAYSHHTTGTNQLVNHQLRDPNQHPLITLMKRACSLPAH